MEGSWGRQHFFRQINLKLSEFIGSFSEICQGCIIWRWGLHAHAGDIILDFSWSFSFRACKELYPVSFYFFAALVLAGSRARPVDIYSTIRCARQLVVFLCAGQLNVVLYVVFIFYALSSYQGSLRSYPGAIIIRVGPLSPTQSSACLGYLSLAGFSILPSLVEYHLLCLL